ncbi:hypothetical protein Rsub_10149 [Raphidocelis subcapitata]|uniref:Glycosyltransferase subfamily 4-like N-terminal domain-containing protein n=1 Tax=Raphidocelis subcapitata TaxID=307507 RepID=A0A2V0PCH3_9CHLO|nr:hypothetical protein Rsub_10149 [Raphidocelis subcapitata]|eukprot:GBF97548.1 hypothetical protein Rsub_10149 [Raphidocelis subcapitata]
MRLLFITIEYQSGTFSGNGIYSMQQVAALAAAGHKVMVIAGRPAAPGDPPASAAPAAEPAPPAAAAPAAALLEVTLPTWGTLDAGCAWEAFASGSAAAAAAVAAFAPAAVLGVDWHSGAAYAALRARLPAGTRLPYVYSNYRVFTRTASGADADLLLAAEAAAVRAAALVTCLSRSDAAFLGERLLPAAGRGDVPVEVLLPALRSDMAHAPLPEDILGAAAATTAANPGARPTAQRLGVPAGGASDGSGGSSSVSLGSSRSGARSEARGSSSGAGSTSTSGGLSADGGGGSSNGSGSGFGSRPYISCFVRLSPEKEAHRFVELVAELEARGALRRHGLTPLLVAGTADTDYARAVKAALRAAAPSARVEERFAGPAELAALYRGTRLNVHPPVYDAYGMTGAPSLVSGGGHVGATDLLSARAGECFEVDMAAATGALADAAEALLADAPRLAAAGAAAASKARAWDLDAYARRLVALVEAALGAEAGAAEAVAAEACGGGASAEAAAAEAGTGGELGAAEAVRLAPV